MSRNMARSSLTALGIGATLAFGAGIVGSTLASSDGGNYGEGVEYRVGEKVAQSALSMEEIIARLNEQGYTDIDEVEHEHGKYEAKARDAEGRWVELYVDPKTGGVLRREYKD